MRGEELLERAMRGSRLLEIDLTHACTLPHFPGRA
jgi:hypothetical protein